MEVFLKKETQNVEMGNELTEVHNVSTFHWVQLGKRHTSLSTHSSEKLQGGSSIPHLSCSTLTELKVLTRNAVPPIPPQLWIA